MINDLPPYYLPTTPKRLVQMEKNSRKKKNMYIFIFFYYYDGRYIYTGRKKKKMKSTLVYLGLLDWLELDK